MVDTVRIGRFSVSGINWRGKGSGCHPAHLAIFGRCIILEAKPDFCRDDREYVAYSPDFDPVHAGVVTPLDYAAIPRYDWLIHTEPDGSFTVEARRHVPDPAAEARTKKLVDEIFAARDAVALLQQRAPDDDDEPDDDEGDYDDADDGPGIDLGDEDLDIDEDEDEDDSPYIDDSGAKERVMLEDGPRAGHTECRPGVPSFLMPHAVMGDLIGMVEYGDTGRRSATGRRIFSLLLTDAAEIPPPLAVAKPETADPFAKDWSGPAEVAAGSVRLDRAALIEVSPIGMEAFAGRPHRLLIEESGPRCWHRFYSPRPASGGVIVWECRRCGIAATSALLVASRGGDDIRGIPVVFVPCEGPGATPEPGPKQETWLDRMRRDPTCTEPAP